jgi:hypothetical protein
LRFVDLDQVATRPPAVYSSHCLSRGREAIAPEWELQSHINEREGNRMARLIDELKREHAEISRLLDTVKNPKMTNKEAHKILISAKSTLISHLKKEDLQLYPLLNRAAENNSSLKRTVDFYAKDMDEITAKAIGFFDKYSKDDAPIDLEFAKAFGNLFATISRRLRSEESTLYKEYEKLSV